MNMRLKLPNKDQKSCTNKMPESPETASDTEEGEESLSKRIEETSDHENKSLEESSTVETQELGDGKESERGHAKSDGHEPTSTTTHSDNSKADKEANDDEKDNNSKETAPSEEKSDDESTKTIVPEKEVKTPEPDEKHIESTESDLPNIDNKETHENEKESDKNEEDGDEKSNISSKLDADALSASLSSSRCLLKRNRDDLDSGDDSEEEEEEPYSKKSHIGEVTPKFVSKLKSTELLASMSSSNKSVLKRGIEKVDKASAEELTDAPESKKSNLTQTPKPEASSSSSNLSKEVEDDSEIERKKQLCPIKPVVTPEQESSPQDVKIVPKTLRFPSRSPNCQNQGLETVSTTPSSPSIREKAVSLSQEEVKEEVKQKIGAKELAGQRQLERKRLNKMLSIFDDQKIVK